LLDLHALLSAGTQMPSLALQLPNMVHRAALRQSSSLAATQSPATGLQWPYSTHGWLQSAPPDAVPLALTLTLALALAAGDGVGSSLSH